MIYGFSVNIKDNVSLTLKVLGIVKSLTLNKIEFTLRISLWEMLLLMEQNLAALFVLEA